MQGDPDRLDPRPVPGHLRQDPGWTPTHGSADSFTMVDLLTAAGAVATIA